MHKGKKHEVALLIALNAIVLAAAPARAQDAGFGLGDPYRHYADPGNGGGSAYAPFFDPYRGNRIVRGAYPDAAYDGRGSHYGKSAPSSMAVNPGSYEPDAVRADEAGTRGDRYRLRDSENATTLEEVDYPTHQLPGTIVVDTSGRHLYFVERDGRALRYGIGVGRQGFAWRGTARIGRKAEWPSWTPPREMLGRRPDLPLRVEGGPANPLGARALYLYQGTHDTMFRIHGTNEADTIGQAVSSGCIRMLNADVIDLFSRVPVGTTVRVLRGHSRTPS